MKEKHTIVSVPIDELISKRWSPRAFDVNKSVSKEQIISICEAGRWAPSCSGDEPWKFLVWDKNSNHELWNKAFNVLSIWNQKWVINAPVLIAATAAIHFCEGKDNRWSQFDTGAACENIYLQAFSLGLIAHPMGGFDEKKLIEEFNIPQGFTPMAMIAVGYQANENILDSKNSQRKSRIGFDFRLVQTFLIVPGIIL